MGRHRTPVFFFQWSSSRFLLDAFSVIVVSKGHLVIEGRVPGLIVSVAPKDRGIAVVEKANLDLLVEGDTAPRVIA